MARFIAVPVVPGQNTKKDLPEPWICCIRTALYRRFATLRRNSLAIETKRLFGFPHPGQEKGYSMRSSSTEQIQRALIVLVSFHIVIIGASNYLVQIPFQFFGVYTNWGTFSFPLVYLATDLTVRVFGSARARKIIFKSMLPALLLSYTVSILFSGGKFQGLGGLATLNIFVLRIAVASFVAYLAGQLLDVRVFSGLRSNRRWWVAPSASTIVGNLVDTVLFYTVAFYLSSDQFMATHWPEIALVDYLFKLLVSIVLFLPVYGIVLRTVTDTLFCRKQLCFSREAG